MKKILIANRGEIASRIIRTCKKMGIGTIAIYSEADRHLSFVSEADEAVFVGKGPVSESYLQMDRIIDIAIEHKAEGIHPGYGLLSENGLFAKKVGEAGLIFIGPKAEVIEGMGDKIAARNRMEENGIPVLPASEAVNDEGEALLAAEKIGYPVMLKSSQGGGGIGLALCQNEQELRKTFRTVKMKTEKFFAKSEIYIEKFVEHARHIEVQIFGDQFGNMVHMYERDCSIQRRNQKVVEETPSPFLSETGRERIYRTAIQAAKAIRYENAGTIEFLVDEKENFYFLEMNTRLQVEHGITEAITGLDLVEWQILISQGKALPLFQEKIKSHGAAMEFRVYAEHPKTFYPSPGTLTDLTWGEGEVRIDAAYEKGNTVTPFYDPLIAKCIFHAENRDLCLDRARTFFSTTTWKGIETNIPLFLELLKNKDFLEGRYTTQLLKNLY